MKRRLRTVGYRVESLLTLAVSRAIILSLPFPRWSHLCGKFHCETLRENMERERARILAVRRAIRWAAKWVPWESRCLDQAVAAQQMLYRRKLPTTLYLGMEKNGEKGWGAHAWVRCGDEWVIGHESSAAHTVVGTYAKTILGALLTSTLPAS